MNSGDNFAFLLPIMMATFGAVFLFVARHGGRGGAAWGVGYVTAAAALAVALAGIMPPVSRTLIANALALLAFAAFASALRSRFGLAQRWRRDAVLSILAFAGVTHAVLVLENLRTVLVLGNVATALLLLGPLVRGVPSVRRPIDWVILVISGLIVADILVRTVLVIRFGSDDLASFPSSTYAFAMQVSTSMLALFFALSALAAVTIDVIEKHREAAERDPLSGLLNRRGFEIRSPAFTPMAVVRGTVVTCDIDHFKRVNDALGHAAGDRVIAELAALLRRDLPAGALAARFGGEEFVLYLPDATPSEAVILANRARLAFSLLDLSAEGITAGLTASFGVAAVEPGDHSLHDTLARADERLYAAKLAGRNRVVAAHLPEAAAGPRASPHAA